MVIGPVRHGAESYVLGRVPLERTFLRRGIQEVVTRVQPVHHRSETDGFCESPFRQDFLRRAPANVNGRECYRAGGDVICGTVFKRQLLGRALILVNFRVARHHDKSVR